MWRGLYHELSIVEILILLAGSVLSIVLETSKECHENSEIFGIRRTGMTTLGPSSVW